MKQLFPHFKKYRVEGVLAPLFKMLEASFDLCVPLVMAAIINYGIQTGDTTYVLRMSALLIVLGIVGLSCSVTAQYFAAKTAVGFAASLRKTLFAKIQSLSFTQMDTIGGSTLITRMTSDVNQVQNGVNLFLRLCLRSPFIIIGSTIIAFTMNAKLALVFFITLILLSFIIFGMMHLTMPLYKGVQANLDRLLGHTRENLSGVRVVRAFDKQTDEIEQFEQANNALAALQLKVGSLSNLLNPLTYCITNLAIIAILAFGAQYIEGGILLQGSVIALVNYMGQILVELVKLANLIVQVSKALACAGRVSSILEREPDMHFATQTPEHEGSAAVQFENVCLTYHGAASESLSNINFTAQRGQVIGIIGGTGSGKSSLVNLIPRFYEASAGEVSVFGQNVAHYPKEALRSRIGLVPQRAQLFKGTVRSNLLWGNENASDSDLWAALASAQGKDFVQSKPDGLDTAIEQGGQNLSGGQRQRLTIARALVQRPDILILDDSASALDYATDAALRKALAALSHESEITIFIVSQRTSSLAHADQILVLEDGELCGSGTHETLLSSCAVYREIHESQFAKGGAQA